MPITWTKIPKPSVASWTTVASLTFSQTATPIAAGFFLYLTYPTSPGTGWTKISKASNTSWTKITKAT